MKLSLLVVSGDLDRVSNAEIPALMGHFIIAGTNRFSGMRALSRGWWHQTNNLISQVVMCVVSRRFI